MLGRSPSLLDTAKWKKCRFISLNCLNFWGGEMFLSEYEITSDLFQKRFTWKCKGWSWGGVIFVSICLLLKRIMNNITEAISLLMHFRVDSLSIYHSRYDMDYIYVAMFWPRGPVHTELSYSVLFNQHVYLLTTVAEKCKTLLQLKKNINKLKKKKTLTNFKNFLFPKM